ncbi:MAG TPA: hypothetical protein VGR87_00560 [Candidatus Limnocylindria bacterium]|jgi:hypothetical protein|nr:hypothetical protein [Candidatus Limnocylindria bacterium]
MPQEFKVTVDQSLKAENDPRALEKRMTEMSRAGWSLMHITSVTNPGGDNNVVSISRIYLFWQREMPEGQSTEPVEPGRPEQKLFR